MFVHVCVLFAIANMTSNGTVHGLTYMYMYSQRRNSVCKKRQQSMTKIREGDSIITHIIPKCNDTFGEITLSEGTVWKFNRPKFQ